MLTTETIPAHFKRWSVAMENRSNDRPPVDWRLRLELTRNWERENMAGIWPAGGNVEIAGQKRRNSGSFRQNRPSSGMLSSVPQALQ